MKTLSRLWPTALIVLVGTLTYLNALDNPLVFDDRLLLLENPRIQSTPEALRAALSQTGLTASPVFARHYRPVFMLSLWLNRWLLGDGVAGYRWVNLLLHLGCALLVGRLCLSLLVGRGWAAERSRAIGIVAAGLFAVLPVHFPVVALVLKRNSSLSSLLMLLALLLLERAFRGERVRAAAWGAAVACGALAQFCKEDAAVLPALALLYGWAACLWRGRPRLAGLVVGSLALVPLCFALLWFPGGVRPSAEASLGYLLAQPRVLAEYVLGAVQVSRLTICLGLQPAGWPPETLVIVGLVACAALGLGVGLLARRHRLVAFAPLWALICLAPTSSIFPLRLVGDFVRVYLASVGPLLLLGVGLVALGRLGAARAGRAAALVRWSPALLVVVLLMRGTLSVNARHAERRMVWQHAVRLHPRSELANAGLCGVLSTSKDLEQAQRVCQRAYNLRPNAAAALSLVTVLGKLGQLGAAEQLLGDARRRLGYPWRLGLADGRLAWFQDQWARAEQAYTAVLQRSPASVEARVYLADVRLQLGKPGARALIEPLLANALYLQQYPLLRQLDARTR